MTVTAEVYNAAIAGTASMMLAAAVLLVHGPAEAAASPAQVRQLVCAVDPGPSAVDEAQARAQYTKVFERVRAIPGVVSAALASTVTFNNFVGPSERKVQDLAVGLTIVTSDYFRVRGERLLAGRTFTPEEDERTGATLPVVISETLAMQLFPGLNPLGLTMTLRRGGGPPGAAGEKPSTTNVTVVGVAEGKRHEIYVPFGGPFRGAMVLHILVAGQTNDAEARAAIQRDPSGVKVSCR